MTLTQHLTVTGIAAAALAPILAYQEIALFAAGAVLIDVDHYFLYIQRKRDFSIRGMFRYFQELQPIQQSIPYLGLCAFHTFDFFLALALLSWLYPLFWPLLAGSLFHFLLDLIDLKRKGVLFIRSYFLLEHFIRRRAQGYPWY